MDNDKRIRLTTYFAGFIEASPNKADDWRNVMYESLKHPDLLIYCPVRQESTKTGKNSVHNCEYIKGLKQSGHWDKFFDEMWKIWFGMIENSPNQNLIDLFVAMRTKKFLDGNRERDLAYWGDFEAVIRSDFLVAYVPDIKTVGTHWEMLMAALFRIPVYLILSEVSRTDANSTMIFGNMLSGGKIFYNVKEAADTIKEDYKLK